MKERRLVPRLVALFLALLIAQPVWLWAAVHTPELPNPGQAPMTRPQQEQLGLKAMGQVYQQMPVLPDSSPVTKYIQALGKKLDQVIPGQYNWPYQFHVIEQKDINAFALPGGPIFINVGTITAADNEAELAGVMAHEMSHVYMQHSAKQQKQNIGPSILAGLGQVLGSMVGGVGGAIAAVGGQMVGGMWSMKYSRTDEAQADAVGAIILWKAGYNPKAMAEFFQKLEKQGGSGPQFLSDHPNPGNRVQAVDEEIKDWPSKPYHDNSQAFVLAKSEAEKVPAYTAQQIAQGAKSGQWAQQNRKNGAVPRNVSMQSTEPGQEGQSGAAAGNSALANLTYSQVKPSGSYSQYQQNGITISYPSNWQASNGQNGGLTIAPQAAVSAGAVAYGVVMGTAQMPSGTSLDQATQALAQNMVQSNPGLQVSGSSKSTNVNGMQARSQMLMGNSPIEQNGKPLPEQDWLVAVQGPNNQLVYAVFVAPQRDFGRLKSTYQHMLRTLQLQ